jgi:hypothetical protein
MTPTVWLIIRLALEAFRHGVLMCGAPGTGKSLALKALRASLADLIRGRPTFDVHVADFDSKRDLYDIHRLYPNFCPVFDLNPFVWADVLDVMGEVDDPRDIAELAAQLVDLGSNQNQVYFPQAARQMARLMTTRHWLVARDAVTFADVVLSGNSPEAMRRVAKSHPVTKPLLALINETEAGLSVIATLMNEMGKFDIPAALYRSNHRGRRVSSSSLLQGRFSVTRLPYDDKSVEVLASLTRLFVSRLQQHGLAENRKDRLVAMIFDELALIPKGLDLALTAVKGREAGLAPILALQSPTMVRSSFGKEKFDALASTPKTFICFQLPDPADAEWAARRFSSFQGFARLDSASEGRSGLGIFNTGRGWSESFQSIDIVTGGMIQSLGVPTPGNPAIEGFMATIPFRPFRFRIGIPELVSQHLPSVTPAAPPAPRAPGDFVLFPWTEGDLKRLKLL